MRQLLERPRRRRVKCARRCMRLGSPLSTLQPASLHDSHDILRHSIPQPPRTRAERVLLDSLEATRSSNATRGSPISDDQLAFRLVMMTLLTLGFSGQHENDRTGRPVDSSTTRPWGIRRSRSRVLRPAAL